MMRVRKDLADKRADFNRMYAMRVKKKSLDYEDDMPPLDVDHMIENNSLDENLELLKERLMDLKQELVRWEKKQSLFHTLRVRKSDSGVLNNFALRV